MAVSNSLADEPTERLCKELGLIMLLVFLVFLKLKKQRINNEKMIFVFMVSN